MRHPVLTRSPFALMVRMPVEKVALHTHRTIVNRPPVAECKETTNPAGTTIPPAGSTTLPGPQGGQNEDGFYELLATDDLTRVAQLKMFV